MIPEGTVRGAVFRSRIGCVLEAMTCAGQAIDGWVRIHSELRVFYCVYIPGFATMRICVSSFMCVCLQVIVHMSQRCVWECDGLGCL